MEKEIRCCFTGHRTIENNFDKEALFECIEALYQKGVRTFICGGALGFDMVAGYEVLRLKEKYDDVRLWLYLPCLDQDARWQDIDKRKREELLKRADFIDCPQIPYNSTVMKTRNYKMVEESDYCVSYFNGKFISGTAQTIRYAKKSGIEVINLGSYDLSYFR
jgi:uncharacterized phage-like protein YoqJ